MVRMLIPITGPVSESRDGIKQVNKNSGLDHIVDALGYLIMGRVLHLHEQLYRNYADNLEPLAPNALYKCEHNDEQDDAPVSILEISKRCC
jgi:hypothetical protein